MIKLPQPQTDGTMSLENAISQRRSHRIFSSKPLSLAAAGQLLWAGQGITGKRGRRTAPSAGALYPLELYLVAGLVDSLDSGIYHYLPDGHSLKQISKGDFRQKLAGAALQQTSVADCAAIVVLSGVKERTSKKYGRRAVQYIMIEAGHTGQNISLQAETLDLGTVVIGAFDDEKLKKLIQMPPEEQPISLMPVGYVR
ncbi:MAG: SagB/ThcOx family dehydrogenase [Desulfobulbaceae bacterium]|nr:SagB/ThcOx family dehydrogenase [Desulfobulbaceae bacterium]